jgi:hypothetical protein
MTKPEQNRKGQKKQGERGKVMCSFEDCQKELDQEKPWAYFQVNENADTSGFTQDQQLLYDFYGRQPDGSRQPLCEQHAYQFRNKGIPVICLGQILINFFKGNLEEVEKNGYDPEKCPCGRDFRSGKYYLDPRTKPEDLSDLESVRRPQEYFLHMLRNRAMNMAFCKKCNWRAWTMGVPMMREDTRANLRQAAFEKATTVEDHLDSETAEALRQKVNGDSEAGTEDGGTHLRAI